MAIPLACQEQLLPGASLSDKFALASTLGYQAIELRGRGDLAFARRLPELRRARAEGVPMPTVCVEMDHFIGDFDPDRSRDAVRNLRSQLSVIAELGGIGAMTPAAWGMFSRRLPPFEPPRSPDGDRQVLVDALGELGEHARAEGVTLFLEPLNRYEDHMVNRLDEAVALCAAVGLPSVRVVADTFHMNIEEDDVHAALRAAAPYLGHVQVSDSNRYQPGAGHLDWPALLRTLHDIDYRGWLALECRLRGEPLAALRQAAAVLTHAQPWQAAA
ncbi:sugar phosphate isomerase/epimerase family protein [Micromonospora sp. 4G57]|uniref:Sugar phosphate isomerase/epimerase family protein n=1 Tax=Micromonospora sicca TaxID=2202420 RepID=A0ABU5JIC0_9ACTN|nr:MULTISPECIES: sugar phosphate isomerase/epimerase family protein [unclassified Micromonospora]MDZ5446859.1 sugar phosphate isomerase/epimerase family protein [Micromonospora sp. 4G57]MDZ5492370.1 sugar phosphate isomerase/epimerase family protein [Micromonospora sp. 4G53]